MNPEGIRTRRERCCIQGIRKGALMKSWKVPGMKCHSILLFISLSMISFHVLPANSRKMTDGIAPTIIVPRDYPTIQSAIDAASEGSTILVRNGTYVESLYISKSLRIYGNEDAPTILQSPDGGDVVHIRANDLTFARFQVKGIKGSFGCGIRVEQSHRDQISDNVISGNLYGIYIWDSSNITMRNNNMTKNSFNFGVWGLFLEHFLHDIDSSNDVEGKPVRYLVNEKNKTVPLDAGYVALVNSTGIVVRDLNLANNFQGVLVSYSVLTTIENISCGSDYLGIHMVVSNSSIIIQNDISNNNVGVLCDLSSYNYIGTNVFSNNSEGLQFSYSPLTPIHSVGNQIYRNNINHNGDGIGMVGANDNRFCGNEIIADKRYGIFASSSNDNVFWGNTFSTNGWGLYFDNCSNNIVYNNNFVNNTSQVHVDTLVNSWNLSQTIGGNYWSDNAIADVNEDGIADFPYVIDEANVDYYPLAGTFSDYMISWESGEYPMTVICNSSNVVFEFFPQQRRVSLNFTDADQASGFCRISISKELVQSLWEGNLTILINGTSPSNLRKWEYNGSLYVYFTYTHSNSQAIMISEIPFVAFPTLFFILSLVTTIVVKKKSEHGENMQLCSKSYEKQKRLH
jgi:parallel beta-helix repeat protein